MITIVITINCCQKPSEENKTHLHVLM